MEALDFVVNFVMVVAIMMLCGSINLVTIILYTFIRILTLDDNEELNKKEFALVVILLFVGTLVLFKTLVNYIILGR